MLPKGYVVQVTVKHVGKYHEEASQVPTFVLLTSVQGITSKEHAKTVVEVMLYAINPNLKEFHISIEEYHDSMFNRY